jgi:rhomboid protease GluP
MNLKPHTRPLLNADRALKLIITTNIAIFILSLLFSRKDVFVSMNPLLAFSPSMNVLRFLGASGTAASRILHFDVWWTFITANWLHGSLVHLLFNMVALRQIAPLVIQEYGLSRMFTIYTLSGIVGFFLSYKAGVLLTVGASAGICGMIGASLFFGKTSQSPFGQMVYKQTSGWVVTLILIGFLLPNINNWGHGGGLIGGIFFAWVFGYLQKRREMILDKVLAAVCAGVTVFLLGKSVILAFFLVYT